MGRSHLAGGGRAHHGLVGRGKLGGVEQAGTVDGNIIQSAEWRGSKVQVEAPEKAEPSHCHSWDGGGDPELLTFLLKAIRMSFVRVSLGRILIVFGNKSLIP